MINKYIACILFFCFLVLPFFSLGQLTGSEEYIKGKVVDSVEGRPLTDATIRWKGIKGQVKSDINGRFELRQSAEGKVLQVSFVGYRTKEILIDTHEPSSELLVYLSKNNRGLEDVIVNTGYQNIPKERATGSFTFLSGKDINLQSGSTILERLDGVSNSVLFDNNAARPRITVRGLSSINGPKDPLIVVDNFPYDGDIDNINPDDVESISILKDAAAASIWGSRAGNGVIVITTKKGRLDQPLRITFNSSLTTAAKPDLFYLQQINPSDFIDVEKYLFGEGYYNSKENNVAFRQVLSPVVELLIAGRDNQLSSEEVDNRINLLRQHDLRNDYAKNVYENTFNQRISVGFSGGSQDIAYKMLAGYDKNKDALSQEQGRINLNAKATFHPMDRFRVSTAINYTQSNHISGKNGYSLGQRNVYPYLSLLNGNGEPSAWYKYRQPYIDTAGHGKLLDWKYYPLTDYEHDVTRIKSQDILINLGMDYSFLNDFSLSMKYQYETLNNGSRRLQDLDSYAARDMINSLTAIDPKTGEVTRPIPLGSILTNNYSGLLSHSARGQLNYNKTSGDHQIAALGGMEIRHIRNKDNGYISYGYDDELLSVSAVDFQNRFPNFITGYNQSIFSGLSFDEKINRYTSVYGNASYTYKGRYILSGSARKDASNLFGVKSNERGVPLWSLGGSWNVSEEGFYHSTFLPYLKARLTYGYSGNIDNSRSAYVTINRSGESTLTGLNSANIRQYPNPELRWERVKTVNFGLDFTAKKRLISGSVDVYRKKGLDLFGTVPTDYTNGLNTASITKNASTMAGWGIDAVLHMDFLNRKEWQWSQMVNFSYNTNKIKDYYLPPKTISNYLNSGVRVSEMEGRPVYSVITYKWAGLDGEGNPQGYLNGQPTADYADLRAQSTVDDLAYVGSAMPCFFGNLLNTVRWKGLALSVNVTYKMDYYFMRSSILYNQLISNGLGHADFALRWLQPGDENRTSVPSFQYPNSSRRDNFYKSSEILATRGDHIRLQFINLSYDIKKSEWNKLPIQGLGVYVNASNLGIIWKANKYDIDPDYVTSIPSSRTITFGMRATLK